MSQIIAVGQIERLSAITEDHLIIVLTEVIMNATRIIVYIVDATDQEFFECLYV
jgi:hypothetical protein